ncbi:hypothetical protein ABT154_29450 [Streptomyces sp. NPDC001728]
MGTTTSVNDDILRTLCEIPGPIASVYLKLEPRPQRAGLSLRGRIL